MTDSVGLEAPTRGSRARTIRALTCAAAGCLVADAAYAQGDSAPTALQEVIVTAQKRAENVQDAPVTVQALTSDLLDAGGAVTTRDLQSLVAGVTFNANLTAAVPYVRGVGQNTGSIGVESPVAVYIDGVYLVAPASGLFSFNNIERIEVLKGPQGTLFGRNTTGGVINVVTKAPSDAFDWNGSVGYGNYNTISADAYVTGQVRPGLSTSLSAYVIDQQDGHLDNVYLKRKIGRSEDYGIQNKWLWRPTSTTEVGLNLFYNWKYGFAGTTGSILPGRFADDRVTTYTGDYSTAAGIPTSNRDSQGLAALTIHQDVGPVRVTSITSWHRLWDRFNFVQNGNPLHNPFLPGRAAITQFIKGDQETKTQEFQLQSQPDADLQWILGAFYLYDQTRLAVLDYREGQFIFQGSGANRIVAKQRTESYALYLDGSKTILPRTRLTLGVRYTEDRKSVNGSVVSVTATGALATTTPANPGGGLPALRTPSSWGEWTYRAVLDHHFTEDIMAYASYNRGFKSGLYNITVFFNQPVEPEIVDAYEVGLKSELFDRRLRLNISAFKYDYKDVQLRATPSQFPGRFFLTNAAEAEIKGVDVDFTAIPMRGLTVFGGFEVLDAKYKKFPGAPFNLVNPVTAIPAGCTGTLSPASAFVGGVTTVSCDASGSRMIRSPTFTANLGARYEMQLDGGSQLTFDVNDHYSAKYYFDPDHLVSQPAYHELRAGVTWTAPSGKWDVAVWGRNLTDEVIYLSATGVGFTPGFPRTYGVTLNMRR